MKPHISFTFCLLKTKGFFLLVLNHLFHIFQYIPPSVMINHFLSHCFENAILVQIYLTLKECKLEIAINNETSLFYRFKFLLEYFYKIKHYSNAARRTWKLFRKTIIIFHLYIILLILWLCFNTNYTQTFIFAGVTWQWYAKEWNFIAFP